MASTLMPDTPHAHTGEPSPAGAHPAFCNGSSTATPDEAALGDEPAESRQHVAGDGQSGSSDVANGSVEEDEAVAGTRPVAYAMNGEVESGPDEQYTTGSSDFHDAREHVSPLVADTHVGTPEVLSTPPAHA